MSNPIEIGSDCREVLVEVHVVNQFRRYVFDLDGTLLSSTPFYLAILDTIFARNRIDLTDDDKRLAMGLSARAFLTLRLSPSALDEALIHMREQSQLDNDHIPLFEGLEDVLSMLHGRGDRLAVWTSRERNSALQLIEKRNIRRFFDIVVTADCVTKHKPDPEGLFYIANHLGCELHEMVMIGDHDVDIMAAHASGSVPVRANWHGYRSGQDCELGAVTVHSVTDLSILLRR